MNRDDIIRMAREARLVPERLELSPKDEKALVRFATLVASHEREECAKVCDEAHELMNSSFQGAAAIRSRGNMK